MIKYVGLSGALFPASRLMRWGGIAKRQAPGYLIHPRVLPATKGDFRPVILSSLGSPFLPLYVLRHNCRQTEIEPTGTRRSALLAREEAKVAPLWGDRAEFELVQDLLLTFALDELPVATARRSHRGASRIVLRSFLCAGIDVGLRLRLKHGFFGGMPTPKAILVEVHPTSLSCKSRDTHKLVVARQDDLRRTARLWWRKTSFRRHRGANKG